MIKHDARFFYFTAGADNACKASELGLPEGAKVVCFCRDNSFVLAEEDTPIKKGDEVVILTHGEQLPNPRERWAPKDSGQQGDSYLPHAGVTSGGFAGGRGRSGRRSWR